MNTLSVHLVTWNGATYIPYLFDSLRKQTYTDWKLYIWDNGSQDTTVEEIQKELNNFPVQYELYTQKENSGFAGGHNALYQNTTEPFFLLLNQDMYVMPTCFADMVHFLQKHNGVAAVSPRLMRWNIAALSGGSLQTSFSDTIDALGLKVFRNRRVIEKYTGKVWNTLKPKISLSHQVIEGDAMEVFGVSGAFPLYRRSAIHDVALVDGSFLDSTYHSYKEDVDLAFRLRSAGYAAYILLESVAYHDRSAAGPEELSDNAAAQNKKSQSAWVKHHSYKNHIMTLYKNEYWQNFFLDFPFIVWYECKKLLYFLLFDRTVVFSGVKEIWHLREHLKKNRKHIQHNAHLSYTQMRVWWTL